MQETQETLVQSPGQEDSPGEGHGNSLQQSCLENPMDFLIRVRQYLVYTYPSTIVGSNHHFPSRTKFQLLTAIADSTKCSVQAAFLSLRTETKQGIQINANPSSPWKTSGLTGQILPALPLIRQVHCLYIYRTDLMTTSTSAPCSIMSQITKTSSSM